MSRVVALSLSPTLPLTLLCLACGRQIPDYGTGNSGPGRQYAVLSTIAGRLPEERNTARPFADGK